MSQVKTESQEQKVRRTKAEPIATGKTPLFSLVSSAVDALIYPSELPRLRQPAIRIQGDGISEEETFYANLWVQRQPAIKLNSEKFFGSFFVLTVEYFFHEHKYGEGRIGGEWILEYSQANMGSFLMGSFDVGVQDRQFPNVQIGSWWDRERIAYQNQHGYCTIARRVNVLHVHELESYRWLEWRLSDSGLTPYQIAILNRLIRTRVLPRSIVYLGEGLIEINGTRDSKPDPERMDRTEQSKRERIARAIPGEGLAWADAETVGRKGRNQFCTREQFGSW